MGSLCSALGPGQACCCSLTRVLSLSRTTVGKSGERSCFPLASSAEPQPSGAKSHCLLVSSPHTPAAPTFKGSKNNTGPGGK